MVKKIIPEAFNHKFKPEKSHAQILMKITPFSKTYEEAKKIIEECGASVIEKKHFSSDWILMKLNVGDMRGVALKLTESGFSNIKGINALHFQIEQSN